MKGFIYLTAVILMSFSCQGQLEKRMTSDNYRKAISTKERLRDSIVKTYYEDYDSTLTPIQAIDSLDLNFDKVKDLIIEVEQFHGGSTWDVYYYDSTKRQFIEDTIISTSPNPIFDYKNKFIYSLYLGPNQFTSAESYKWNGRKRIHFKHFEIIYSGNNPHKATAIFRDKSDRVVKRVPITVNDWYPPTWIFR